MGLDQYLYAEKAEIYGPEREAVFASIGFDPQGERLEWRGTLNVQVAVAYWRKAFPVSDWFEKATGQNLNSHGDVRVSWDLVQRLRDFASVRVLSEQFEPGGWGDGWGPVWEDTVSQLDRALVLDDRSWSFFYRERG